MSKATSHLQVEGLHKHFAGLKALDGVSFSLAAGECVALIGPNGAGKSTCFACIAGQLVPSAGQLLWRGQALQGLSPAKRLHMGLARTFQVAQTFESLTVLENLQLALSVGRLSLFDRLSERHLPAAQQLLEALDMGAWAGTVVSVLPYGLRKRLELGMAQAGLQAKARDAAPGLLLLDEPAAGLGPEERLGLMQHVRALAHRQGHAVLYTEHNMDAVFGVADRVIVLMGGRIVVDGGAQEVLGHERVRQQYLGGQGWPSAGGTDAAH
jgi:branched-chain amino acid transport system ATP-binding protein